MAEPELAPAQGPSPLAPLPRALTPARERGSPHPRPLSRERTRGAKQRGSASGRERGKSLRTASEAAEGDGVAGGAEVGAGRLAAWNGRPECWLLATAAAGTTALRERAGGGRLDG